MSQQKKVETEKTNKLTKLCNKYTKIPGNLVAGCSALNYGNMGKCKENKTNYFISSPQTLEFNQFIKN